MPQNGIIDYNGIKPKIADNVFIAPGAYVIGDVEIAEGCSIWFNCVLRGDVSRISIGANSNVQDGCTIHGAENPTIIETILGSGVSVGHNAVLHACTIEDEAFIGMGSIILTGAVIGKGSLIAAGSLVGEGKIIPPGVLAMGTPAKVVRELRPDEVIKFRKITRDYVNRAALYQPNKY